MEKITLSSQLEMRTSMANRVEDKLLDLIDTASFNNTRWLFDWKDELSRIENILCCNAELEELRRLTKHKIIEIKVVSTPDINRYGHKAKYSADDYKISDTIYIVPESDKAREHYHSAVWIIGINIEKFNETYYKHTKLAGGEAQVKIVSNNIVLTLPSGKLVILKSLRRDGAYMNFMRNLLLDPNRRITRGEIQLIDGCATANITELVRMAGFDKFTKKIFFSKCSATELIFNPVAKITPEEEFYLSNKYEAKS